MQEEDLLSLVDQPVGFSLSNTFPFENYFFEHFVLRFARFKFALALKRLKIAAGN